MYLSSHIFVAILFFLCAIVQLPGVHTLEPCTCPRGKDTKSVLREWRLSRRMIMLGSCSFMMGSNKTVAIPGDKETPVRSVKITEPFWVDKTEVTSKEFSKFIKSTKYKTTAEELGTSFVFAPRRSGSERSGGSFLPGASWWVEKKAVTWKSNFRSRTISHPVTHVSWFDAMAYCQWQGGTLPTEQQWEFACRGGFHMCLYPWGNALKPGGQHMTNIWQGQFPQRNTIEDGFEETAPVGSFPPNPFGLYDVAGNVWEWVLDSWSSSNPEVRVQKGGSFMCHRQHCFRYRCGARTKGTRDSTSSNLGFRCVQTP